MDFENDNRRFESVYSNKVKAGKRRTYFFDVRRTKGDDFYLTLTESTKRFNGEGYERHKIFLYKEDFHRFRDALSETIEHVKTELMPDYDYDEFTRRHIEWEAQRAAEDAAAAAAGEDAPDANNNDGNSTEKAAPVETESKIESEDDMEW